MKEMTKNIIEGLGKLGAEKIKEADNLEALTAMVREQGVEATSHDVQAALEKIMQMADSKQELDEETMENVAGGFGIGAALSLIPGVISGVKWVYNKLTGKQEQQQAPANPAPASPAASDTVPKVPGAVQPGIVITQTLQNNMKVNNQSNVNSSNQVHDITF
ncbi:MAG: hypothetical protein K6F95_08875 [Selenomonas sp.]|uniref:hypothetical protein n=1 Tax=Selenomonas sp. TaxID=2053611 RepID=UPI0025E5F8D6|nr:hypothetical protein [Selenomonas sp.]MCR5758004.1 hypothetical protein [Selenomonas sp.]